MNALIYDNPSTMRRECWARGRIVWSCAFDLFFVALPPIQARTPFLDAARGPWRAGQMWCAPGLSETVDVQKGEPCSSPNSSVFC